MDDAPSCAPEVQFTLSSAKRGVPEWLSSGALLSALHSIR